MAARKPVEILRYAMFTTEGEESEYKPWLMIKIPGAPKWHRIYLGTTQSAGVWVEVYDTQDTRERRSNLINTASVPTSMEIMGAIADVAYSLTRENTDIAHKRLMKVRAALDRYVEQGEENESK